jgi:hypothetical protein
MRSTRHLGVVLLLAACGGSTTTRVDAGLPADAGASDASPADAGAVVLLRAQGSAAAGPLDGEHVVCDFFFDLEATLDPQGWHGTVVAGEVARRVYGGEALRFEFTALVGGPASLRELAYGVEVRLVGEQPDDAAPFWLGLEALFGGSTDRVTATGDWLCAPVLPDDPATDDSALEAAGSWTLERR